MAGKKIKKFFFANFLGPRIVDTKNGKKIFLKILPKNFWKKICEKISENFFSIFFFAFLESTYHDQRKLAKKNLLFFPPLWNHCAVAFERMEEKCSTSYMYDIISPKLQILVRGWPYITWSHLALLPWAVLLSGHMCANECRSFWYPTFISHKYKLYKRPVKCFICYIQWPAYLRIHMVQTLSERGEKGE